MDCVASIVELAIKMIFFKKKKYFCKMVKTRVDNIHE